jgi:bacteriocin-like protein
MKELNYKELMNVEGGKVDLGSYVGIDGYNGGVTAQTYSKVTGKIAAYSGQKTIAVNTSRVQFGMAFTYGLAIN